MPGRSGRLLTPTVIAAVGALLMLGALVYGFSRGALFAEGAEILARPWGLVTLIDIYVGFVLFGCWVLWREPKRSTGLMWLVSILVLGNLVSCVYVLRAAHQAAGDAQRFWMGARR